jgi:hypothetical protein
LNTKFEQLKKSNIELDSEKKKQTEQIINYKNQINSLRDENNKLNEDLMLENVKLDENNSKVCDSSFFVCLSKINIILLDFKTRE